MVRGYRVGDALELFPGGAALIRDGDALVVADLHLGCESVLEYDGLSLPRVQTKKLLQYLLDTVDSTGVGTLVVAGDLKHNFSRNLQQEWADVNRFVSCLKSQVRLLVVKGNHDNYLGSILSKEGVRLAQSATISGVRVIHGHREGPGKGPLVLGHIHPSMSVSDSVEATVKSPCFLFNRSTDTLVLPALSIVAGGVDVVRQVSSDRLSPALARDGLSAFEPILCPGGRPLRFPEIGKMRLGKMFR